MLKNKGNLILIAICAILSILIVCVSKTTSFTHEDIEAIESLEESIIDQDMTAVSQMKHTVVKLYDKGVYVGAVNDREKMDDFIIEYYNENYAEEYPNTDMKLSSDLYFTEEESYFYYEDKDEDIKNYLVDNQLFAINVNRIEFSNGAVVYCKNIEDFETAKDQYLLNYVDQESLILITNNQLPPELVSYGERITGIQVAETYVNTMGYANVSDIKTDVKSLIEFFSYGYGTEMNYYTTEEYDTVEWVAQQFNLTAQQLITLNMDVLKSDSQLLSAGTELNVTLFNSPITVLVNKERIAKEVVYADSTIYKENSSLREGVNNVLVEEQDGSKNVYYSEIYVNGVLSEQNVTYEEITLEPVREVVEYGTKVIPGVGTGKFRWPVDYGRVSCHWGCYNSPTLGYHTGVDIQNSRNKWGYVLAADRGTIEEVGYNSISGNYVYINHNNGYRTYYGHLKTKCYFKEGTNVEKGEVIGQIGMTGAATGPHVHFVIYTGKTKHDACKWLGC